MAMSFPSNIVLSHPFTAQLIMARPTCEMCRHICYEKLGEVNYSNMKISRLPPSNKSM